MPTPFAALEARTASVCVQRLANASVTGGATSYSAILDQPTQDAFGNALSAKVRALTYKVSDDPALKRGDVRTVNAVAYKVSEAPSVGEDGQMAVVLLEAV